MNFGKITVESSNNYLEETYHKIVENKRSFLLAKAKISFHLVLTNGPQKLLWRSVP